MSSLPSIPTHDWCTLAAHRIASAAQGAWAAVTIGTIDPNSNRMTIGSVGSAPAATHPAPTDQTPLEKILTHGPVALNTGTQDARIARAAKLIPGWANQTPDPNADTTLSAYMPLRVGASNAVMLILSRPIVDNDRAGTIDPISFECLACALRHSAETAFRTSTGTIQWLTEREHQILDLLIQGCSVRVIAEHLDRSPHTVHDHVKSLHRKLDASSRGSLIATALGHRDQPNPPGLPEPVIDRDVAEMRRTFSELKPVSGGVVQGTTATAQRYDKQ